MRPRGVKLLMRERASSSLAGLKDSGHVWTVRLIGEPDWREERLGGIGEDRINDRCLDDLALLSSSCCFLCH